MEIYEPDQREEGCAFQRAEGRFQSEYDERLETNL